MKNIIVNIFVIGFHHKRGYEVEFVYPTTENADSATDISENWKNLSSLALPDGAHKINSDIFNFILPGNESTEQKILFGISCFKQISSCDVKNKADDVTRNSIQKSVVVLSTEPLFNSIGSLLHGITENYFELGDFSQREILVESYHQLNEHFRLILEDNSIKHNDDTSSLTEQGFSISDLILRYEHNLLSLIKMIILRGKLLFMMEPISKLTSTILCLVSLFPGEFKSCKFQEIMKYVDDNKNDDLCLSANNLESNEDSSSIDEVNDCSNNCDKSMNNENSLSTRTSLFQNIKSGGGQAIKVFSSFAVPGLMRSSESDMNTKQSQIDDFSAPLPPFIDKVGYVRDKDKLNCSNSRDSWGFPLGIFDERNILLPYSSLGFLNVLDNKKINSFIIGASNHLWKMKNTKMDVIINEDNKSGGLEFCNKESASKSKKADDSFTKLSQLTVLDRRLADYLLRVVKSYNCPTIKTTSSSSNLQMTYVKGDDSLQDFTTIEIADDVVSMKIQDTSPDMKFPDKKSLDEWIRQVLTDYIKAALLSAAGWGTRQSFLEFGSDFMLAVQQLDYFQDWYYSVDKNDLIKELNCSHCLLVNSESILSLSTPSYPKDTNESETHKKATVIMNYDHPGRTVPGRLGDNIPGYYQMKEYADQSKALVNRSVNEIKRIGSEKSGQFKLSMSAGLSKLSGIAKVHSSKLGSSWWGTDSKAPNKDENENNKVVE